MSRDPRYQRLLNSRKWWDVKRIVWQRAGGLCERCKREGYVTAGVDCHHKRPVESAHNEAEMERLAYDLDNIELLCVPCHIKTHQEMFSHTKEEVRANRQRRHERWSKGLSERFLTTDSDPDSPESPTTDTPGP